ncbi:MAG: carboxypeptidase-like regulatory domain-containing protein [Muribaculaceae bacterium]|nr:carboxypeptidase-like regulatory domain-containing protein [Muribaculaceae bacterium]
MRYSILFLLICILSFTGSANQLKVLDERENEPIIGATIFSRNGIIIGITDKEGVLDNIARSDYPLLIKCLGYEQTQCEYDNSLIKLTPSAYDLPEVVVIPTERPIIRVICYMREYISGATGSDTIISFNEHMADFFLNPQKVKGFKSSKSPRILSSMLYIREVNSSGLDSIYKPDFRRDDFAWDALIELPEENVRLSQIFSGDNNFDTIPGKSGIETIRHLTTEQYTVQSDYLAEFKHHSYSPWIFKMLGLTIEFDELQSTWIYNNNNSGVLSSADILSGTFTMSVKCKGKWIKKSFHTDQPIRMYGFYEIYPIEVEFLTKEEAKLLKSQNPYVKIHRSPFAQPLPPAVQRIIDRAK